MSPGRSDQGGGAAARPAIAGGEPTRIAAVVLAGFLLRLWRLGGESLGAEEGRTWTLATTPLAHLIARTEAREASVPLFQLLTAIVYRLGRDEASLRLVSVLASTVLVVLTYRLARLAVDRRVATVAAALAALSPFQLLFAQEARPHATGACFTVLALYLFARAALLGRPRAWLPYVAATTLALYTSVLALPGIAVQAIVIASSRAGRLRFLTWAIALGVAIAAWLPWLLTRHPQGHHDLLGPPSPEGTGIVVLRIALVVPLLAALWRLRDAGDRGRVVRLAWLTLGVTMAAALAAGRGVPGTLPGPFVLLTPTMSVLIALGLEGLRPRLLAVAWTALALVASAHACFRYFVDDTREPWREAASRVAAASDPDSTAVIIAGEPDAFEFYNARLPRPFRVASWAATGSDLVLDATRDAREVWAVARDPDTPAQEPLARLADSLAAPGRALTSSEKLVAHRGTLRLRRWRRVTVEVVLPPRTAPGRRGVGVTVPPAAYDTLRPAPVK